MNRLIRGEYDSLPPTVLMPHGYAVRVGLKGVPGREEGAQNTASAPHLLSGFALGLFLVG